MRSRVSLPFKLVFVGTLITLSVQAVAKHSSSADPLARAWGMPLERNIDRLPTEGDLDEKYFPWAEARFPFAEGALLNRYQREDLPKEERARKRPLTFDEIKGLPPAKRTEVLSRLSPAELFDIARHLTATYPLTSEIRRLINKPNSEKNLADLDEKMNFGWAAAATSFQEPAQVSDFKVRFPEGTAMNLSIGSADVKGLASYYYGVKVPNLVKIAKVGSRCQGPSDVNCRRIDPASFHVLLTNMIKRKGRSFIADIDPSATVDYRPIVGYETDGLRAGHDGRFTVHTIVRYAKRRLPLPRPYGIFNLDFEEESYDYTLEIDSKHRITGGEWISERHPEFVWRVKELPHVDHEGFSALKQIYQESPIR